MSPSLQVIETRYRGYRFRSRLEARWAVFFDALQLLWEYEPQGFKLRNGLWYLPDFRFPRQPNLANAPFWVEIKGSSLSEVDDAKISNLVWESMQTAHVFCGPIETHREASRWDGESYTYCGDFAAPPFIHYPETDQPVAPKTILGWESEAYQIHLASPRRVSGIAAVQYWRGEVRWGKCEGCGLRGVFPGGFPAGWCTCTRPDKDGLFDLVEIWNQHADLDFAFAQALSARFGT